MIEIPRFAQPGTSLRPIIVPQVGMDYCLVSEAEPATANYMPTLPISLGFAPGARKRLYLRFRSPRNIRWLLGLKFGAISITGSTGALQTEASSSYVTESFDPVSMTWDTQPAFSGIAFLGERTLSGGGGNTSPCVDLTQRSYSYAASTGAVVETAVSDELGWRVFGSPASNDGLINGSGQTLFHGICVTFEESSTNTNTAVYPDPVDVVSTDNVVVTAELKAVMFEGEVRS